MPNNATTIAEDARSARARSSARVTDRRQAHSLAVDEPPDVSPTRIFGARWSVALCSAFLVACGASRQSAQTASVSARPNSNTSAELAPPPPTPATVRIGTFNIENFGWTKANDGRAEQLATIVAQYDIVAVQEISDVRNRVPTRFLEALNAASADEWAFVASERSGRQPDDHSSAEQYAYFWNTDALEQIGDAALFDDEYNDHFQREPFAARFRARHGGFTFVLVTVHTAPNAAVAEIDALVQVVGLVETDMRDRDVIVLGDFNAGCSYATPTQLDALALRGEDFVWIVPDDADTNVAATTCAYDRIVATRRAARHFAGTWGVDDEAFDPSVADLSDHWPVWATFTTGEL